MVHGPMQSPAPPWCSEPTLGRLDFHLEVPTLSPSPAVLIPPATLGLGLTGWAEVILALFPFRFKYVLVNTSTGLVQDETLWSDPIRTRRREWG